MNDLSGKHVFITGGASGIGLGIAQVLAASGMKVSLADIDEHALAGATETIERVGGHAFGLTLDVCDASAWGDAAERAESHFGPVQVLCSNAGVSGGREPLESISAKRWNWVFDVNVNGSLHAIQTFVPRMRMLNQEAHVVLTASLGGFLAIPLNGVYSATKFALIGMAETLKHELADSRIGVSVLCPGLVHSALHRNSYRLRPDRDADESRLEQSLDTAKSALDPREVGALVRDGIRGGHFWLFTHPELQPALERRFSVILKAMQA